MDSTEPFQFAIIGGGLCGLALAIALKRRNIPFEVYEARSSFTELGAGINIGPNSLKAFELIDQALGEAFKRTAARNRPGKENLWFELRFGAAIDGHEDGAMITELMAPPTGNMRIGRDGLLQLLAEKAGLMEGEGRKHALFNKKLNRLDHNASDVDLYFEDGTKESASAVIACDGIHSAVRRALLGPDSPAAIPRFSEAGVYRALLSMKELEKVLGHDMAHTSQVFPGPNGYLILYPTTDSTMNTGFWVWRQGSWPHREWAIPGQKKALEDDFKDWGDTIHKIMDLVPDPPFFATYYHAMQPGSHWEGKVCLIGDAAHAMPPHAGAGAEQAMEDAYVMAEVLNTMDKGKPLQVNFEAAFNAYEAVRRPRYQSIVENSVEGMHAWADLYDSPVTEERLAKWIELANSRFKPIWRHDLAADAEMARAKMREMLKQ